MSSSNEEQVGRSKHLARLALIFYRRGASWSDFGGFLDALFRGNGLPWKHGWPGHVMACRHNEHGKHHDVLQRTPAGAIGDSSFNPEHYKRPCLGWGKGDDNKSPGIVVDDLLKKARAWLSSNGKGVIVRDRLTRSPLQSSASSDSDSWPSEFDEQQQVLRGLGSPISRDEVAELLAENALAEQVHDSRPPQEGTAPPGVVLADEMSEFEEMFTDEELLEIGAELDPVGQIADSRGDEATVDDMDSEPLPAQLSSDSVDPQDVPMSDLQFATSSDLGTQVEGGRQSSTKMRVATLALLRQFTGDPGALKETFALLRSGDDSVLHLCGDGIKFTNENGVSCSGCVEPTHLMLGSLSLNRTHLIFHKAMQACCVDDYLNMVGIAHRAEAGCRMIF
jgi:hypothetical protein